MVYESANCCKSGHYGWRWVDTKQCCACHPRFIPGAREVYDCIIGDPALLARVIRCIQAGTAPMLPFEPQLIECAMLNIKHRYTVHRKPNEDLED